MSYSSVSADGMTVVVENGKVYINGTKVKQLKVKLFDRVSWFLSGLAVGLLLFLLPLYTTINGAGLW